MSASITLQSAFVLHARVYRETSYLLDLFTMDHGRLSAVARGVRGARKSRHTSHGLLMPFVPLLITLSGKNELLLLNQAESNGMAYNLNGKALLCGLYLNEILVKTLHRHDSSAELFLAYETALLNLQEDKDNFAQQQTLRIFEKTLLKILGYELRLDQDILGEPVTVGTDYLFSFGVGLQKIINIHDQSNTNKLKIFSGSSLLALASGKLNLVDEFNDAKRLLRMSLQALMDNRSIKTRELFLSQV